ncbi:MAG: hypothetical protein Q9162_006000 [Coniocarpon cinnabarinum]
MLEEDETSQQLPAFRTRKRRRVEYRRKDDRSNGESSDIMTQDADLDREAPLGRASEIVASASGQNEQSGVSRILKQRKLNKGRKLGLTTSSFRSTSPIAETCALVPLAQDELDAPSKSMAKRFVKQAGRTVNELQSTSEDMFIDRRLAELNGASTDVSNQADAQGQSRRHDHGEANPGASSTIEEVNLSSIPTRWKQSGLSNNPRNRRKAKRRPSEPSADDIARNKALEAVLADASLDYYSKPSGERVRERGMDEVLAQEFEQQYWEEQEQKRQRQPPGMLGERGKGPKLGGSRSQRATAQGQEKKKTGGVMPT